ncbi:short chain dehydrogenase reductase [Diplodia corticola]|uniref:Short chain dehydrogenase reductase n=1 Tax=Diplodia corticola TaxID=236234 RepID=A0A1J9SAS5_9PEZI|nr:short chain dehydrogenase reductase [Diplodia corticola]OJD36685.1 short chain dehydrogenase reductase [Diplodia corticola]
MSPISVFAANNTALITGGASGIGLAVAQLCLKHSMRVAIADWNAETLAKAEETLGGRGKVDTYQTDVSNPEAWAKLKGSVLEKFGVGSVDFLMLNAGVGMKGTWGDAEYFEKTLSTNLFGVINGLNAFVPAIRSANKPSAIVITGSKQGITNPPGNAAYNASKAAVKTLAEHLAFDLRADAPATSVHLLVPGWTFTGMTAGGGVVKEKPAGAWSAEQIAGYMYQKMGEDKFYIICPDNDVSEETDKKRMLWSVGDVVNGRPPLTRWRAEWKEEAEKWMSEQKV